MYYETVQIPDAPPVAIEQGFKVPIVNPVSGEVLPGVSLYGRMDLVLKGTLVEHKTSARKPDPSGVSHK